MNNSKKMKNARNCCIFFAVSLAGYLLACLAVTVILAQGTKWSFRISSVQILWGALFWAGILTGTLFLILCVNCRKQFFGTGKNDKNDMLPGVLCFYGNKPAYVIDTALFLSAAVLAVLTVLKAGSTGLRTVFASLTLFSFTLHCFVNGNIFHFVISYTEYILKEQKKHE